MSDSPDSAETRRLSAPKAAEMSSLACESQAGVALGQLGMGAMSQLTRRLP